MPAKSANDGDVRLPPTMDAARAKTFIVANTRLLRPPLVPEIQLHLAEETLPIWHKSEDDLAELGVPSPYWAFAWAGGQAIARYILDHPEVVAGRRVIDIGTGSGLVAIAAKRAGAVDVLAADIDVYAIAAVDLNAASNGVQLRTTTNNLLLAMARLPEADVAVLGDLFYDFDLSGQALRTARRMAHRGTEVLAGDPDRWYFPRDAFESVAQFSVPVTRELEDTEIKNSAVWRFRP